MKQRISRFRLLLFELWSIVYDGVCLLWKWVYQSWSVGWNIIFGVITSFLDILLSKQVWVILIIAIIILSVTLGPSTLSQAIPQINEWRVTPLFGSNLEIFFHHPTYVAGNDYGYFEVSVQNAANASIHDVVVSIRSTEGLIIFDEGNLISAELLSPGMVMTKKLPFHTAQNIGNTCITTTVVSAFKSENGQKEQHTWSQNTPGLCTSLWRVPVVVSRRLPDAMQTLATYLGYLSTMLAGVILLFKEQLRPMAQKIWTFLKR